MRKAIWFCVAIVVAAAACHSGPFEYASQVGPFGSGADQLLTRNPEQDYWPTWTEDTTGLMYAYVYDLTQRAHRCMGVMPVGGGQRYWEWCDNVVSTDSLSSFPAFALGHDGRLIYVESSVSARLPFDDPHTTLWLADSAHPHERRPLVVFPMTVGDSTISWLGDLQWTGPASFLALGQHLLFAGTGTPGTGPDSIFTGGMIVAGTITASGATLAPIAGTAGATGFARIDAGASLVFTQRDNTNLLKVPLGGGMPVVLAAATTRSNVQLTGISCRDTRCVVAVSPVAIWRPGGSGGAINGAGELWQVSLVSGESTRITSRSGGVFSSPLIAPNGDIAVQFGMDAGHLQTFGSMVIDLRLYSGLLNPGGE